MLHAFESDALGSDRYQRIQTKVFFRNAANGVVTVLVRMAPGTSAPQHRHAEIEESYVLEAT